MSAKFHLARFSELKVVEQQEPRTLTDDRARVLWVLSVTKDDPELAYLSAAEISEILCEVERINVPRQRVTGVLQKETDTAVRRKSRGQNRYKIMQQGLDEISPSLASATYVDPQKALTHIRRLEEVLASLKGDLKVCDPYVENRTLDYFAECTAASSVKLLTANVLKESSFRRDLAAFCREHGNKIEIRVAPVGLLHDRYILYEGGMLLLGTSLNGFSKKQSFIVPLGPDIRSATDTAFNRIWGMAKAF